MDNNQMAESFGSRLRSERLRLGMTQEQLAQVMGVKKLTVLQYEKGKSQPHMGLVYKLQEFGFNMQYLIFANSFRFDLCELAPSTLDMITSMVTEIERNFGGGTFTDSAKFKMHLVLLNKYLKAGIQDKLSKSEEAELVLEGHHVKN